MTIKFDYKGTTLDTIIPIRSLEDISIPQLEDLIESYMEFAIADFKSGIYE